MTKLTTPNLLDILRVCANPQKDEIEQHEALTGVGWDVDAVAMTLFNRSGLKFVLRDDDGNPIAIGGFDELISGVWDTWMICADGVWKKHWRVMTKTCNQLIQSLFDEANARRIQTTALLSREKACKWYVKGLRMDLESVARNFGLKGEDVACFVRFRE